MVLNERYDIVSVNLSVELLNKINNWIYAENKSMSKSGTLTTSLNSTIIEVIDSICENRSELLRGFVIKFLDSLEKTFKDSFSAFASKGAFLRSAIYFSILKNVERDIVNVVQKQEYWIKYNGKTMSKNEFLGNTLVKFGNEFLSKAKNEVK